MISLKKILKLSTVICFFPFILLSPQKALALDPCDDDPTTFTNACWGTPDRYVIKVYEMGLCTSDPLGTTNFNKSTCTATLTSTSGVSANLAGQATQDLSAANSVRPPNNSYSYAYIIISNDFGLKASYSVNGVTYYSTDEGDADTSSPAENWTETLNDFDTGCTTTYNQTISSGKIKARLTDINLATTASGTCGSTRLVGSFESNNPIVINDSTKGLEVSFTVTNSGMTVVPQSGTNVDEFNSGPFKPSFTVY